MTLSQSLGCDPVALFFKSVKNSLTAAQADKKGRSNMKTFRSVMTALSATSTLAAFALAAGGAGLSAGPAFAQQACSEYTIVSGDTLSRVANRANVDGGFRALFAANSDVLESVDLVEVGQVVLIPCADGTLPSRTAVTLAQPTDTTADATRPLRIVTASDYAPFTDEKLPGGGFFTQLVDRAVTLGNPDQEYSLFFVNDWGSQLDSLLPTGAIDMAFPWFKPDCSKVENLSASNAYRCTDFNHSDPFYDALVGFYTLTGSAYASADSYDDLFGARLCRPTDWFTFDLESEQLVVPNITLTRADTQLDCWELLENNEVDVVTYDALPAQEDYTELGMAEKVVDLTALASTQTLHVFVSKNNKIANDALPIINAGLNQLRLSGEWFTIVSDGISATFQE